MRWFPFFAPFLSRFKPPNTGFDPNFLATPNNINITPLPKVQEKSGAITILKTKQNQDWAHHFRFSVMMNKEKDRRSAICAAANLRDDRRESIPKGKWKYDWNYKEKHQVGEDYYGDNPWDCGHLVMRYALAWGNEKEATKASKSTYRFTNATLQHREVNQDEILHIENLLFHLLNHLSNPISNNNNNNQQHKKANIFVGPVYTKNSPIYFPGDVLLSPPPPSPSSSPSPSPSSEDFVKIDKKILLKRKGEFLSSLLIPNSFFHIFFFPTLKGLRGVGVITEQTRETIEGRDRGSFLVSITHIEKKTGLIFDENLKKADIMINLEEKKNNEKKRMRGGEGKRNREGEGEGEGRGILIHDAKDILELLDEEIRVQ